jgi:tRNA uridine 5-carboxymethylaminomethyl modification enzyme
LVREIDALGGIMGLVADEAGIQFRLLNTSRGPAVWSPRAQEDKALYRTLMRRMLERTPNLFIKQAEVMELLFDGAAVVGIELQDGRRVGGQTVILTTGTFLNGLIHIGEKAIYLRAKRGARRNCPGELHSKRGFRMGTSENGHAAAFGSTVY